MPFFWSEVLVFQLKLVYVIQIFVQINKVFLTKSFKYLLAVGFGEAGVNTSFDVQVISLF